MENEKNELTLFSGVKQNVYCSKAVESEEDKKELFNALETCDVVDEETGELKKKYRTILFDASGQTYATGSYGIYNIIKKIVTIYGLPETWANPLKVKVAKRPIGNGKQSLTLTLV